MAQAAMSAQRLPGLRRGLPVFPGATGIWAGLGYEIPPEQGEAT